MQSIQASNNSGIEETTCTTPSDTGHENSQSLTDESDSKSLLDSNVNEDVNGDVLDSPSLPTRPTRTSEHKDDTDTVFWRFASTHLESCELQVDRLESDEDQTSRTGDELQTSELQTSELQTSELQTSELQTSRTGDELQTSTRTEQEREEFNDNLPFEREPSLGLDDLEEIQASDEVSAELNRNVLL